MDIYLKEVSNKKSSFRFPSMPDKEIEVNRKQCYHRYNIIRKGVYSFPSGPDVKGYKWTGYFFGEHSKRSVINQKWLSPASCIRKLEAWRDRGAVLNLIVSGGGINVDVTIESFDYKPFGGLGDYSYELSFLLYRPLKLQSMKDIGKKKKKKKTTARADPQKETDVKKELYEVKPGDNLWDIARKCYGGSGEGWIKIYNANKTTIETAAKKRGMHDSDKGKWIFTGTTLTIPS